MIPRNKPYIILEGDPRHVTAIEYGDFGSVIDSPTFKLFADNFVARNIIFKVKIHVDSVCLFVLKLLSFIYRLKS